MVLHFAHLMVFGRQVENVFDRLVGAAMTRHLQQLPYSQARYRSGNGQVGQVD